MTEPNKRYVHKNEVIAEFKRFLDSHDLELVTLPDALRGFISFVVGARIMSDAIAKRQAKIGQGALPMNTRNIFDDSEAAFECAEAAEVALALECQDGMMYLAIKNSHVEIPTFRPESPA